MIQSLPEVGLVRHIADSGEAVRLSGEELKNWICVESEQSNSLISEVCSSLLCVPLKNCKERLLGIMKLENQQTVDGMPQSFSAFSEVDEVIAVFLANQIAASLENIRTVTGFNQLVQGVHTAQSLDEIFRAVLQAGMVSFRADRGDIVLWDESKQALVLTASEGMSSLDVDQVVPDRCLIRTVWNQKASGLHVPQVSDHISYHSLDKRTRSEILMRLEIDGRAIGVLNFESFQSNGFDEQDLNTLQRLAEYAAVAIQVVGHGTRYRGLVQQFTAPSPPRDELPHSILESVRDIYGFDAGVIYIVDHIDQVLRCSAYMGCEHVNVDPKEQLIYRFDDLAIATKVLRENQGYFSHNPATDPKFDPTGVRIFQICGPLIAVPMSFGDKAVGVLVVWSRQNHLITPAHIERLEPFARIAAANVAIAESERRRSVVLKAIQNILTQMQSELDVKKNLGVILHGVLAAGFDRVRLFKREGDTHNLIYVDSLGMEAPDKLARVTIAVEGNPYLKDLSTPLVEPIARIYTTDMHGQTPAGLAFDRPDDLPWVVMPLVILGRLHGYIGADTKHTRREITQENLDYVTLLGVLAAQAIANADTIETLRASRLKDEFLQRMAHIFGSTTSGVQMLVQNLRDGIVNNEQALKEYIPLITRMNERFLGLAQNLVDFAALREDTKLNIESVSLVMLVEDTIYRLQGPAQGKSIRFVKALPKSQQRWELDPVRTSNAIEALLDNAIKFSPSGAAIYVKVSISKTRAQIVVRDQGQGIPSDDMRFIFDSFYRGRNARDKHIDGTGLGLSIVEQTMRLHCGNAEVWNHPEGGTEFTLTFPKTRVEDRTHDGSEEVYLDRIGKCIFRFQKSP